MTNESLPELTWDPREPETRKEHHPRGVLHDAGLLQVLSAVTRRRGDTNREAPSKPPVPRA